MIFSKSSNQNDAVYGKSISPIQQFMVDEEQAYLKITQLDKIFKMTPVDQYAYSETYMTAKGDMEDTGEGSAYPETSQQQGYQKIVPLDSEWKLKMPITQTMIEDAQAFDPQSFAKDFMLSYTRTREKFGAFLFNNGTSTTATFGKRTYNLTSADGQALFSTAHPSKTGKIGNQSNLFDATFSYDNLLYAEEKGQDITDDDGNLMLIQYDTIVIPNDARLEDLVYNTVYTTSGKPGSANAGTNTNGDRWNVIKWPVLAKKANGQSPVFLLDSKRIGIDGLKWLDRIPLTVKDYVDENTDNLVFKGRARFNFFVGNWRAIAALWPSSGGTSLG